MYFDAAVVLVTNSSLLFRLALAILWYICQVHSNFVWCSADGLYILSLQHPYFISLWISLTLKKVIPKLNSNICNKWKLEQDFFFYAWHFRSWILTFRRCLYPWTSMLYRIWLHVKILASLQFLLKIRAKRWERFYAKFATIDSGQTKKKPNIHLNLKSKSEKNKLLSTLRCVQMIRVRLWYQLHLLKVRNWSARPQRHLVS